MKKLVFLAIITASLCASFSHAATSSTEPLDKIVAIINDDVITQSEFNTILNAAKRQVAEQHLTAPDDQTFQKQVLNQFINKKLQLQLAKQTGIKVTPSELNKTVESIAKQNNLTVSDLYDRISQSGMSKTTYLGELKDQLTLQKLQQQEAGAHLSVSQEEITDYIRSQAWHNDGSKEYHLEDVLVPLSEAPTTEEIIAANSRAKAVINKFNQGQALQTILQASSLENPPLQGGDLGWRKLPDIPPIFAAQVVHMQASQAAGPIQAPNGFHILHLVTERAVADKQTPPDRKQVEELLLQRKFDLAAQTWVSKMRSQAFVQINI